MNSSGRPSITAKAGEAQTGTPLRKTCFGRPRNVHSCKSAAEPGQAVDCGARGSPALGRPTSLPKAAAERSQAKDKIRTPNGCPRALALALTPCASPRGRGE